MLFITIIVLIGVGSSYYLPANSVTAVMTMVGGALMALINILAGVTGTQEKPDRPEFEVIQELIEQVDRLAVQVAKDEPMAVNVENGHVSVRHGAHEVTTETPKQP